MPLIMMCGPPCSGKSRRAVQLGEYFACEHPDIRVTVVSSDSKGLGDKNALFSVDAKEKELRGHLRSEVQRTLTKEGLVILDAPNYVKGYRYELYCMSKACKTTNCVIHCDVAQEVAWKWNVARDEEGERYERTVFDALFARFEAPDSRNRWDSPLFVVQADDAVPREALYDALFRRRAPPPNQSTQCQPLLSTNFLYELDRTTQDVVGSILGAQRSHGLGEEVAVAACTTVKLRLSHLYTPMELARLRRQFITYCKMHPVEDHQKLAAMFVQYLNGTD